MKKSDVHVPTVGARDDWRDAPAVYSEAKGTVEIMGNPVMEDWQVPFMKELASVATGNGGVVLEVGFGLGIASSFIQENPRVTKHIIIEANRDIFAKTLDFAATAEHTAIPIFGFWEHVCDTLRDESVDGILYDTYPIVDGYLHVHQFMFAERAYRLLKPGGVMTYCNLTSWGQQKLDHPDDLDLFRDTQMPHFQKLGFTDVSARVLPIEPTVDPRFNKYTFPTIPVPVVRK